MKPGGGKRKGAQFEREICLRLSLWVTCGRKRDVFWRSAMSGGRATVARGNVRQCGDICAVAEEGYQFASEWFIECKHVKSLNLDSALVKGTGTLYKFWKKARREARKYQRDPMLICRQNGWPVLVVALPNHVEAPPMIQTKAFDVTLFEDMVAPGGPAKRPRLKIKSRSK